VTAGPGAVVDVPAVDLRPPVADAEPYRRVLAAVMQRMEFDRDTRWVDVVKCVLRLRVRADGTVDPASVRMTRSTGFAGVDRLLLDGLAKLRFRPATAGGVAVAAEVTMPVALVRR
jgi:TonB family protein